jgi:glycosyltransferase involved in cell wall biosynthesis
MNHGKLVALIVPFLGSGGVERNVVNLAQAFMDVGISVDLVVMSKGGGPFASQIPRGVNLVELSTGNIWSGIVGLRRYLIQMSPTAVLAALTPANIAAVVGRALSKTQARVVVSVHIAVAVARSTSPVKAVARPLLYRHVLGRADSVVAVSHGVAETLKRFGIREGKIRVIYNPIVNASLYERAKGMVDHEWFKDHSIPIIVGVGRLHKQKGWPTLLRAFRQVRNVRAARLVIIGEGDERPRLERLIRELALTSDVQLLGFQSNPYKFMARADVFVLSSSWEGLGNVIVEALALGRRVVATDCPSGPREILVDGKYGRLVPVGDPDALASGILATLDAPFDEAAAKERAKDFAVDRVAQQYLGVLGIAQARQ